MNDYYFFRIRNRKDVKNHDILEEIFNKVTNEQVKLVNDIPTCPKPQLFTCHQINKNVIECLAYVIFTR